MKNQLLAIGKVEWICVNGIRYHASTFNLNGPDGDSHRGFTRRLSGHDGAYLATSQLKRGDEVFNHRTWTALSTEEIEEVEGRLGLGVPIGCLLENLIISGVPNFSKLPPMSRLVFPKRHGKQAILLVSKENTPCKGVGQRLEAHHNRRGLSKDFISCANGKRGVMGFVFSAGIVVEGDEVSVYPPAE